MNKLLEFVGFTLPIWAFAQIVVQVAGIVRRETDKQQAKDKAQDENILTNKLTSESNSKRLDYYDTILGDLFADKVDRFYSQSVDN